MIFPKNDDKLGWQAVLVFLPLYSIGLNGIDAENEGMSNIWIGLLLE